MKFGTAIRMVAALGATMAASSIAVETHQFPLGIDTPFLDSTTASNRVDVSIGVMSRCPDALFFENAFSRAVERVNPKINLSLYFIATPNSTSSVGASCKHGDQECQGNIHQLCIIDSLNPNKAGKRYDLGPSAAQRLWWDFVQCENYVGGLKRIGEESLAKQCIKAIGGVPEWEADGIRECTEGKKGRDLLKNSIKDAQQRGIEKSATLQIEGKTVCIRDDNQWKDCSAGHETSDWVRLIEDAYRSKNYISESRGTPSFQPTALPLLKRQTTDSGNGTGSSIPGQPPGPSGTGSGGSSSQGAPLSVFVSDLFMATL